MGDVKYIGVLFCIFAIAKIIGYSDAQSMQPVKCAVCSGPPYICERLYRTTQCDPPNNICLNHLVNHNTGTRTLDRRCTNQQTCLRETNSTYANDKCRNFDERYVQTVNFECFYCCDTDQCNVPVKPTGQQWNLVG